ncbi:DUF1972 domain-containing protein [uncultured Enterobacter sp.]|uniref:DUF1972 domain-containing protein n=1 Tax=uncultured Enterobacter sp. TaxID=238202 RepID=UPI0025D60705|nr:DUF1972 domain-containing protein [uncultured Enterobacter sp.]
MKKISIIGIVGIPASYGGFESLVENLTRFSSENINYEVFCSSKQLTTRLERHNGAKLKYIPLKANGIQSIAYDMVSIMQTLKTKPDVILVLGVSGAVIFPFFKLFSRSKIITNIDGLEWRREKWGRFARLFLKFSEYIAIKFSDVIITDNQALSDYVYSKYKLQSEVIAYGGDHAVNVGEISTTSGVDTFLQDDKEFFLSICRIEPENNIHLILDSFTKIQKKIKFIGNWNSSEYGRGLVKKYSHFSNIELINPIYDINLLYQIRMSCTGYLHGHSAGGTNPSLVEAMHFGKPIYAYDCSFNRFTTEGKAFYFTDSDNLVQLLNVQKLKISENAAAMQEIAERRYTWKIISRQYESLY